MIPGLSDDEGRLLVELQGQLANLAPYMKRQTDYLEGTAPLKSLGIATPAEFERVGTVVGWPARVALVPAERVRWRGWIDHAGLGLSEIARDALVSFEFAQMGVDAGVYGQGYVEVSEGDDFEPDVVVQAVPTPATTGLWNARKHRLDAGYSTWDTRDGRFQRLFTEHDTVTILDGEIIDRWEHGFGRPTLVRQANSPRPSRPNGHSDIDAYIRYYTDNAVRTILGMEVSREFYINPQRYAINMEPEDFGIDPDAPPAVRRMQGWSAAAGAMLVAPPNEDGEKVQLGQFQSEGPGAFWESVRYLAELTEKHAGLPLGYLGFSKDNPSSADAIRATEWNLVQKCRARLDMGSWASREVALLSLLVRDGDVDSDAFRGVSTQWEDVETPTRSAAADSAMKLTASGILPAGSQVTQDMVGLSDQQQEILRAEQLSAMTRQVIDVVQDGGDSVDEAKDLRDRFDALGLAVRAGVDPEDAAGRLGLQGIKFTGAVPVSLRQPESESTRLEER